MKPDKIVLGVCPWGQNLDEGIGPFDQICDEWVDITKFPLEECSALLLWGGQDIDSTYYKQKKHPYNGSYLHNPRDLAEWHLMHKARELKIPIIGVCRGAQFLCVFAGGSLYQHVNGHNSNHSIETHTEDKFVVTSSHHQMMDPTGTEHKLLAWAEKRLSTTYEKEKLSSETPPYLEPEIVHFPEINGMAIQPHPEWMKDDCTFNQWLLTQLISFLEFKKVSLEV